MLIKTNKLGS